MIFRALVFFLASQLAVSAYQLTTHSLSGGSVAGSANGYALIGSARGHDVPSTSAGGYTLGSGFFRSAYFQRVIFAPLVVSLTPDSGQNTGKVEITELTGANFLAGAAVKLSKSGQSDITATNIVVASQKKITCTFDLTGTANGLWDITVTNTDGRSGALPSAFRVNWAAPTVSSITPARGVNTGKVDISGIAGQYFAAGAQVTLVKAGEADISAENVLVESAAKITCRFNLTGKTASAWDVKVINSDGQSGTLTGGFKIEAPVLEITEPVQIVIIPPSTAQPAPPSQPGAMPSATTVLKPLGIAYKLSQDAEITVSIYSIRGENIWTKVYPSGLEGGKVGLNSIMWDGVSSFGSVVGAGVYIMRITSRVDGKEVELRKEKIGILK